MGENQVPAANGQWVKQLWPVFVDNYRAHRPLYAKLVTLSASATALQSLVYIAVIPLFQQLETGRASQQLGIDLSRISGGGLLVVITGMAILLLIAVELRYRSFKAASTIWQLCTEDEIRLTVKNYRNFILENPEKSDQSALRSMFSNSIHRGAYASGFFARRVALSLNDIVLIIGLLVVLFYINPVATSVVLLISTVPLVFYFKTYGLLAMSTQSGQQLNKLSKEDTDQIFDELIRIDTHDQRLNELIHNKISKGGIGNYIRSRISVKQQIRRGSSFVEFVNPIGLLVVGGILVFAEDLEVPISILILYFLVLKQFISVLVQYCSGIITVMRFYPVIITHQQDLNETLRPGQIAEPVSEFVDD